MTPKEAAQRIRADDIQVLVNLNGYTLTARNGTVVVTTEFRSL